MIQLHKDSIGVLSVKTELMNGTHLKIFIEVVIGFECYVCAKEWKMSSPIKPCK